MFLKRISRIITAASLVWLLPFIASAEVIYDESTEYYDIEGKTLRALIREISTKGPSHDKGKHAIAVTNSRIKPSYSFEQDGENCRIASVKTVLEIVIVYPQWVNDYEAPRKVQYAWEKFLSAVIDHEDTHSAYASETAFTLDEELQQLEQVLPCDELRARAKKIVERNFKEMDRKNKEFHDEVYGR